jgi:cellulose biosynthesis protein BcsQ
MRSVAFIDPCDAGSPHLPHGLGWAFAALGKRVLLLDLDPRARLSAACLDDEQLESLWNDPDGRRSVFGALRPALEETGEVTAHEPVALSPRLGLMVGDVLLGACEGTLMRAWQGCAEARASSFRTVSACHRLGREAGRLWEADLLLVATGPSLGALGRAALLAAEHVVVASNADLLSVEVLPGLGTTLETWRHEWREQVATSPQSVRPLPSGAMVPLGYVVMQPSLIGGDAVRVHERWLQRLATEMARHVPTRASAAASTADDPSCLGIVRLRRDLEALALAARKPIFLLSAADGAVGSLANAAYDARRELESLARRLAGALGLELDPPGS